MAELNRELVNFRLTQIERSIKSVGKQLADIQENLKHHEIKLTELRLHNKAVFTLIGVVGGLLGSGASMLISHFLK